MSGQAGSHLANKQSTNNEYNQSNLLIDNVPLSAHKNNSLIKLNILLNKTGRLPGPANFPNEKGFFLPPKQPAIKSMLSPMIILCLVEIQTSEGVHGDPLLRSLLLYTPDHKSYKTWNLWFPKKQMSSIWETEYHYRKKNLKWSILNISDY